MPGRGARDEIGCRRSDDDRVRFACELDVVERSAGVEQARVYRATSERFERDPTDEFGRRLRQDDVHLGAGLA